MLSLRTSVTFAAGRYIPSAVNSTESA